MFREFHGLRPGEGHGRRRWFEGDGLDLMVWLGGDGAVTGLEFGYEEAGLPRALRWQAGGGWWSAAVDAGDASPLRNESPVLLPGGPVPWAWLEARWRGEADGLEPALRAAVETAWAARPGGSVAPG